MMRIEYTPYQPKIKKEKDKEDATFATVGKSLADVISKAKQPTFSFVLYFADNLNLNLT